MPPYRLTSAQKAEFRRKYIANVNFLNSILPEDKQIKLDLKAFDKKVNDPSEQRFYLKSKEIAASVKKREQIAEELGDELASHKIKGQKFLMNRGLYTKLLPSDDPQAKKYNEYVIKFYYKNPEEWTKERFQKLANFDAGDLYKIAESKDMKNLLLDYYEKNEEIIDDAFRMSGTLEGLNELTPELKANFKSITGNYELLGPASNVARLVTDDGYFTLPPINQDILEALEDNNVMETNKALYDSIRDNSNNQVAYDVATKEFKSTMKAFKDFKIDISGPGGLNKYVGEIEDMLGRKSPISPALYYSGNPLSEGSNFKFKMLDGNTVNACKKVFTDDFSPNLGAKLKLPPTAINEELKAKDFRRDFIYDYCLKNNLSIAKYEKKSLGEIAENLKGNLKEQIFRTTSKEYKDFIKAMKEFDDPNHHNHGDYRSVNLTAQCYLVHKGVFTYEDAVKLPPPGDARAKLCLDAIEAASKYEMPVSAREMVKKKVVFDPYDVDINAQNNDIVKEAPAVNFENKKNTYFKNDANNFLDDEENLGDVVKDIKVNKKALKPSNDEELEEMAQDAKDLGF